MVIINPSKCFIFSAACLFLLGAFSHGDDQFAWLRETPIEKAPSSVSNKSRVVKPSTVAISNKNSRARLASISNKPSKTNKESEQAVLLRIEKLQKELAALKADQIAE